ncbi:MAG: tetratricopeptide repeat protein [Elusimicrobia bacterium]|nr:tetratricopeptide repeat protein [Elusimicrobiota bacterium]
MAKRVICTMILGFLLGGCVFLAEEPSAKVPSASDLYQRATQAYQARQYPRARDLFHEYIGQYPESPLYPVGLYYLAHSYQMLGDEDEAVVLYSRLVDAYGDKDFWGGQALQRIAQIKGQQ